MRCGTARSGQRRSSRSEEGKDSKDSKDSKGSVGDSQAVFSSPKDMQENRYATALVGHRAAI